MSVPCLVLSSHLSRYFLQLYARPPLPLDEDDRRCEMLPAMKQISDDTQQDHGAPDRRRPVRVGWVWIDIVGEAAHHHNKAGVGDCQQVDGQTEAPEAPPRGRQLFSLQAPEENAADGEHVGRHECQQGQGCKDVEGEAGPERDEGDDDGDEGGQVDGVERHLVFVVQL